MSVRWRIKKGDKVLVLSGKDKGKAGEVVRVLRDCGRVFVGGLNISVHHQKPSAAFPDGGVVRREAAIHVSNVAHLDPSSGKATRVGVKLLEDGRKVRYAKRSGELIDK